MKREYLCNFNNRLTMSRIIQSRNRDLWTEVLTVQLGKGQKDRAARTARNVNENGRWLFGHFIQNPE